MRYRCLVLDHDDTAVESTPDIHYPSFVEAMRELRPDIAPYTLEEFLSYCFNPGFLPLCTDILKFNEDEMNKEYEIWKSYTQNKVPDFYKGFPELLEKYRKLGGIICVVSHSESEQIVRHYKINCNFTPDLVFGWELEENKRKPHPYPLLQIMKKFNLDSHELLVVDDLKPGLDMARSCNVDFACAGWSQQVPEIIEFMEKNSDYYFDTVDSLSKFILSV